MLKMSDGRKVKPPRLHKRLPEDLDQRQQIEHQGASVGGSFIFKVDGIIPHLKSSVGKTQRHSPELLLERAASRVDEKAGINVRP